MTAESVRPPMRRVALSVLIGTTIEWYDFLIYGAAAALVFAPLFFPNADPVAGTLLAFSTFAVGFGARPIGAIVLGHFGDRLGRKKMLVLSLSLMGVATVIIGLLPTYAQIGVWAPILLVTLRLVQGFGVGGEWGGAVLTAVEYATPEKRGLYGSLPQVGVPAGLVLSTLAFLGVSRLPEEQFLSWGWRIPFLISVVLVAIGLYIRLTLTETPAFERVQQSGAAVKVPLVVALKTYPIEIVLATGSIISSGAFFYVVNTYALSYGPSTGAFTSSEMLTAILVSAMVLAITLPYFGALSERVGRRRLILIGLTAMAVWIHPTLLAVDSGNFPLLMGAYIGGALPERVLRTAGDVHRRTLRRPRPLQRGVAQLPARRPARRRVGSDHRGRAGRGERNTALGGDLRQPDGGHLPRLRSRGEQGRNRTRQRRHGAGRRRMGQIRHGERGAPRRRDPPVITRWRSSR